MLTYILQEINYYKHTCDVVDVLNNPINFCSLPCYRRIDNDKGKTHELSQSAVKCMRGIMACWMRQADKVEKFKKNQSPKHALHSKFHLVTGDSVSKDDEYEHLQVCLRVWICIM
jgi:phosphorylase kinase alpha/beta subunit